MCMHLLKDSYGYHVNEREREKTRTCTFRHLSLSHTHFPSNEMYFVLLKLINLPALCNVIRYKL